MANTEQRIIELETEVKLLREFLAYERAKPAEIKHYPAPVRPNMAGWDPAHGPFPGDIRYKWSSICG